MPTEAPVFADCVERGLYDAKQRVKQLLRGSRRS